MKKISVCLLVILIYLCLLPLNALALQGQQIEIIISDDGEYLQNTEFSLYFLGDVREGVINPNEDFSSYKVSFDISDSEKLTTLAHTISAYALRDGIAADYTDYSDKNGTADFDEKTLPAGAYLIMAEKLYHNGCYYFVEPTVVVLPYGKGERLTIIPKFEKVPEETESIGVNYRVFKAWIEDDKGIRPIEIYVELLRDGEVYDTVVLNTENNWRYEWTGLSSHYHWTVTEKIVEGDYLVSLSQSEKAFLLTNTHSTKIGEESSTTEVSTTPPGVEPDTNEPDTDEPADEDELPVTGALRWPIPYLAMAGIILFCVGYVKYRKSELNYE